MNSFLNSYIEISDFIDKVKTGGDVFDIIIKIQDLLSNIFLGNSYFLLTIKENQVWTFLYERDNCFLENINQIESYGNNNRYDGLSKICNDFNFCDISFFQNQIELVSQRKLIFSEKINLQLAINTKKKVSFENILELFLNKKWTGSNYFFSTNYLEADDLNYQNFLKDTFAFIVENKKMPFKESFWPKYHFQKFVLIKRAINSLKEKLNLQIKFYSEYYFLGNELGLVFDCKGTLVHINNNLKKAFQKEYFVNNNNNLKKIESFKKINVKVQQILSNIKQSYSKEQLNGLYFIDTTGKGAFYHAIFNVFNDIKNQTLIVKCILRKSSSAILQSEEETKKFKLRKFLLDILFNKIKSKHDKKEDFYCDFLKRLKLTFGLKVAGLIEIFRLEDAFYFYTSEATKKNDCNISKSDFNFLIDLLNEKFISLVQGDIGDENKKHGDIYIYLMKALCDNKHIFETKNFSSEYLIIPIRKSNRLMAIIYLVKENKTIDYLKSQFFNDEIQLFVLEIMESFVDYKTPLALNAPEFFKMSINSKKMDFENIFLKIICKTIYPCIAVLDKNLFAFPQQLKKILDVKIVPELSIFNHIRSDKVLKCEFKQIIFEAMKEKKVDIFIRKIEKNGINFVYKFYIIPFTSAEYHHYKDYAVVCFHEITDKIIENEVHKKNLFIDQLLVILNSLGHDLNNHLTVINSNLSLIQNQLCKINDSNLDKRIERIQRAADKSGVLTEKMFVTYLMKKKLDKGINVQAIIFNTIFSEFINYWDVFFIKEFNKDKFVSVKIMNRKIIINKETERFFLINADYGQLKNLFYIIFNHLLSQIQKVIIKIEFDIENIYKTNDILRIKIKGQSVEDGLNSFENILNPPKQSALDTLNDFDYEYCYFLLSEIQGSFHVEKTDNNILFLIRIPIAEHKKLSGKIGGQLPLQTNNKEVKVKKNYLTDFKKNFRFIIIDDDFEIREVTIQMFDVLHRENFAFGSIDEYRLYDEKKELFSKTTINIFFLDLSISSTNNIEQFIRTLKLKNEKNEIYAYSGRRPSLSELKNIGFDGLLIKPLDLQTLKVFLKKHNF